MYSTYYYALLCLGSTYIICQILGAFGFEAWTLPLYCSLVITKEPFPVWVEPLSFFMCRTDFSFLKRKEILERRSENLIRYLLSFRKCQWEWANMSPLFNSIGSGNLFGRKSKEENSNVHLESYPELNSIFLS